MGHWQMLILAILLSGLACRASRYSYEVKETLTDSDFVRKCEQVDPNSEAAKTYQVLISLSSSTTCLEAQNYLSRQTLLVLDERELRDISPLIDLKHLEWLHLHNNKIEDISPIGKLIKLKGLVLNRNLISDIDSLSDLDKLQELHISHNRIEKIDSLSSLKELFVLDLSFNSISSLNPLRSSAKLRVLDLTNNPILTIKNPKNCPIDDEASFLLRDLCR